MKFAALLLGILAPVFAQSVVPQPGDLNQLLQTQPGAIPTSLTCLVGFANGCLFKIPAGSSDPYVCAVDFVGTGQTIILQDINTVPWFVGGGVLGAVATPVGFEWHTDAVPNCRWFPGGVYIQAGSSGATGRVSIRYQKVK